MPASRIEAALREFVPEPVVCWCSGQSLESRYSASTGSVGTGGAGKAAGAGILAFQLRRARRPGQVNMPRFPVAALTGTQVFLFDGPIATRPSFATLPRHEVRVAYGGSPMWRRLDLITDDGTGQRVYTVMAFGIGGGRKRMEGVVAELRRTSVPG
jgi:hypothetical protein